MELKAAAVRNAKELLPPVVNSVLDLLRHPPFLEGAEAFPMYVLTNTAGIFGAATLLYEGVLAEQAERLESDLYIIPCSVHEVILIPAGQSLDLTELHRIIREVNATSVSAEEVLSDHMYLYQRGGDGFFALPPEEERLTS